MAGRSAVASGAGRCGRRCPAHHHRGLCHPRHHLPEAQAQEHPAQTATRSVTHEREVCETVTMCIPHCRTVCIYVNIVCSASYIQPMWQSMWRLKVQAYVQ